VSDTTSPVVLVGGVGELYQGDLDLGRVAVERLAAEDLGRHVLVEDLHYGAVAVAQRLEELAPPHLVLVGGVARGRPPGSVERRRVRPPAMTPTELQLSVGDAVVGYVSIDLVVEVACALGALPVRTVAIEVEPSSTQLSDHLSPYARAALDRALELVRDEARRAPVLDLAGRVAERCRQDADRIGATPAGRTLLDLLKAIAVMGDEGRWGRLGALRERLGREIGAGRAAEDLDVGDRALWWALLDELDRLAAAEASR
jgi:Ni,Fe-hydrogenase maturation factor